nr:hypothetical protein [Microvirga massiliensis]
MTGLDYSEAIKDEIERAFDFILVFLKRTDPALQLAQPNGCHLLHQDDELRSLDLDHWVQDADNVRSSSRHQWRNNASRKLVERIGLKIENMDVRATDASVDIELGHQKRR